MKYTIIKRTVSNAGYTLIQLLMVIAVLSAITVATFQFDLGKVNANKTKVAAIEIQRYLEASIEFYNGHAQWPTHVNTLVANALLPKIPQQQGGYNNPWGYEYKLHPVRGVHGDTFEITTTVPSDSVGATLLQYLPNAHYDKRLNILHAEITSQGKDNSLIFVGAESNISSTAKNNCPGNQTGCLSFAKQRHYEKICRDHYGRDAEFDVALQSFHAGAESITDTIAGIFPGHSYYDFTDIQIKKRTDADRWGFRLTMDRTSPNEVFDGKYGHNGQAVMFIYCSPIKVQNTT